MKKLSLIVLMLVFLSILSANVLIPRFIARIWFDESDACFVMFGDEAWWDGFDGGDGFDVSELCFTTSAGSYYLPPCYVQPSESVFVINLSQEIPGFTIERDEDFLSLTNPTDAFFYTEELHWGPQNNLSVDIHPLETGQSAVRVHALAYIGHGEYDLGLSWAKDSQTISPQPYDPVSKYTVKVHLEDSNGNPAPGVTVYNSYHNYATVYDHYYYNQTNPSGNWERTENAIRRSILVTNLSYT